MLNIQKRNVIDVSDWDALVEQTYGKIYKYQQQDGCKERQTVTITVPVKNPEDFEAQGIDFIVNGNEDGVSFETWKNTSIEETAKYFNPEFSWHNRLFWERNFYPHQDMIINDLHSKGLLEAGEYDIKIDW